MDRKPTKENLKKRNGLFFVVKDCPPIECIEDLVGDIFANWGKKEDPKKRKKRIDRRMEAIRKQNGK